MSGNNEQCCAGTTQDTNADTLDIETQRNEDSNEKGLELQVQQANIREEVEGYYKQCDDNNGDKEEGHGDTEVKEDFVDIVEDESTLDNLGYDPDLGYNPAESTFQRTMYFFPQIGIDRQYVRDNWMGGQIYVKSPEAFIKVKVREYVLSTLDGMNLSKRNHLMKREHAAEFCLEIGMNPDVVDVKFEATKKFEEELGFTIKASILDAIFHLINHLDYDNPFGKVNNCIEERDKFKSYMGIRINPKNLKSQLGIIKEVLNKKRLADCFMHGTTATCLEKVDQSGILNPSVSTELTPHDFGSGVYCFKGKLEAALSYGFDRSWPQLNQSEPNRKSKGKRVNVANIPKDNPSVILFPDGQAPQKETFRVGFTDYPKIDDYAFSAAKLYKKFLKEIKKTWKETDENDLKWKLFVKNARYFNFIPETNKKIFYGWLHDSDHLDGTDKYMYNEPTIEAARWDQYCFTDIHKNLGEKKLFIELHMNWAEWVGEASIPSELSRELTIVQKKSIVAIL
mmetsp:Transcript_36009/g.39012  ORF Transcript_36009/g.39012 Transcript_36009/m.39012 type:complete len:510 (+) Transcript_36009:773-2302(+)